MINITNEQKHILEKYFPEYKKYLNTHINELLLEISDLIIGIGMVDEDYLNKDGLILQKLYDRLYNQNK